MDEAQIKVEDEIPFRQTLGIKVEWARDGVSQVKMPWQPKIGNRFGNIHGGAIATLMDCAIASALKSALPPGDRLGGTVELSVRYVRTGSGPVRGEGRVIRIGGRIAFGQADVYDEEGNLLATAQGTFVVVRQRRDAEE